MQTRYVDTYLTTKTPAQREHTYNSIECGEALSRSGVNIYKMTPAQLAATITRDMGDGTRGEPVEAYRDGVQIGLVLDIDPLTLRVLIQNPDARHMWIPGAGLMFRIA